ncbi:MAG: hypothetical protein JXA10_14770 [Anaerolineae bacterium]|nr:hypothetical protein [Anaerolineae bacterium]
MSTERSEHHRTEHLRPERQRPERQRQDRHIRRSGSGISWFALILGIGIGIAAGLIYTWEIDPVIDPQVAPHQLGAEGREDYVVAVALSYAHNRDLNLAFDRLRALRPDQNVWQMVADMACNRENTGKMVTNADIRVLRAMVDLYYPQGARNCADDWGTPPAPLIVIPTQTPANTPTPSLTPPSTKTPTPPIPTNTPIQSTQATATPRAGGYTLSRLQSFCNPDASGVVEVRVYDTRGQGVAGVKVQAVWRGNLSDTFYTGLKPEREAGYADFAMTSGVSYTILIPNLVSDPPVVDAVVCDTTDDGEVILMSYWVNFEQRLN